MAPDAAWKQPLAKPPAPEYEVRGRPEALAEACRRLDVERVGELRYGYRRKSVGAEVRSVAREVGVAPVVGDRHRMALSARLRAGAGHADALGDSGREVPQEDVVVATGGSRSEVRGVGGEQDVASVG